MSLEKTIMDRMKAAMKDKDAAALRSLRAIKSAILLAKTEKGAGDTLTEEQEIKMLQKLVKQRKDSINIYKEQGRDDLAVTEQEEVAVIETFLPKMMDESEIVAGLNALIAQVGAESMKDMGKVMGAATKAFGGKADMSLVSAKVRELLA